MSSKAGSSEGAEVAPRMHSSLSTDLLGETMLLQSKPSTTVAASPSTAALAATPSRSLVAEYKGGGDSPGGSHRADFSASSSSSSAAASASANHGGGRRAVPKGQSREELRAAFSVFDTKGDGSITVGEFAVVFKMLGEFVSDSELSEIIAALDENHDGFVSFEEFVSVMTRRAAAEMSTNGGPDPIDDALSVFDCADNKVTKLEVQELWHICGLLKENLSEEERECVLKEMHVDPDGTINFAKLVQQLMPGNA